MQVAAKRLAYVISIIAVGASLAGCAFTPHELELKPSANVVASTVGQNTRLYYRFSDERDDAVVGHRGAGAVGSKITAESLPHVVDQQIRDGLKAKGYQLVDNETGADAKVTFRLRAFKFDIETGFFTGGQNTSAVLAADAWRAGKTYTNVYRYNSEERIMFVPGGNTIDNQMTQALNQILSKALADAALDGALTGKASGI